jgi:hypothetical protein
LNLLGIAILSFQFVTQAQSSIEIAGNVFSKRTGEPVPFVNIGLPNTRYGTISNLDGTFSLVVGAGQNADSLVFSSIGFKRLNIPIKKLSDQDQLEIYLQEQPNQLDVITVTGKRLRNKVIKVGNGFGNSSTVLIDSISAGSEIAIKIDVDEEEAPYVLEEIQFKVVNNTNKLLKARPHIYLVGPDGQPGLEITNKNIIVTEKITGGLVKIELDNNLLVEQDFFVAIEWLFDKEDRLSMIEAYESFKKYNPEKVQLKQTYIDGRRVTYEDFGGDLNLGWSIASSSTPSSLQQYQSYIRYNSLGQWFRSTTIPAIKVKLNTKIELSTSEKPTGVAFEEFHYPLYKITVPEGLRATQLVFKEPQKHYFLNFSKESNIDVKTKQENDRIVISAYSKTHFRQDFILTLSEIHNLEIATDTLKIKLKRGFNNVASLRISNILFHFNYNITVKSTVAPSLARIDVKSGSEGLLVPVRSHSLYRQNTIGATFEGVSSEIYSVMSGVIVNLPEEVSTIWVGDQHSINILTPDGRIIVYEGDFDSVSDIEIGSTVKRGQLIATTKKNEVSIYFYAIGSENRLEKCEFSFEGL